MTRIVYCGAQVFDGVTLHKDAVLVVEDGAVAILPIQEAPSDTAVVLEGGVLTPGFVDLQANGGGGVMFNDETSVEGLRVIAAAHASTGTRAFLPTLITDTPDRTRAAIEAVAAAIADGVPGIAGLHLEGPHLDVAQKGAHDADLIRPMTDQDVAVLEDAAHRLPRLMLTVAPESTRPAQIARLARAGVLISLGHSNCSYDTAMVAFAAGARCVTHLFNAMSPLRHRAPGLVGAALDSGAACAGIIADGVHVHPAAMRAAVAAKRGPGGLFLVTDAMATLSSELQEFRLGGRRVLRAEGRLTLEDGTLAGADLTMPQAIRVLTQEVGVPLVQALSMATTIPARLLSGSTLAGPGFIAPFIHLSDSGEASSTEF
ncbi:N-acetylglucosamine-6-phosphate deacetylase [Antarctobacter heliothermus]|uniref:N-acetylglucosamine 6-phosphate deacetylase n=1 Tax=Antarctobacter heliothermus TaxID=74033 RepID=A0A239C468_9RHOB|nr:N-acetylglucosamine-6-phosphate deacetylase [Antarctobacter heliothermus]SNS14702.1 N-acetylglucosamine 6-phosphate deacetylase [Antarctobacter heliothermus]